MKKLIPTIVLTLCAFAMTLAAPIKNNHATTSLGDSLHCDVHQLAELAESQECMTEDVRNQINVINEDIRYYIERYHDHTALMLGIIGVLITVIVALTGVVAPWLLTKRKEKGIEDNLKAVGDKFKEIEAKLRQAQDLGATIKEVKDTIDVDKKSINGQQTAIEGVRDQVLKLQEEIQNDKNAIEEVRDQIFKLKKEIKGDKEASQKAATQSKVNALISQSYKETDPQKSIELMTEAIKLDPKCATAYYNRGCDYSAIGDKAGAIKDYDKAIELNPNYAAYYNRGIAKSDLGDKAGAIRDYDKAIELDSNDSEAFNNRGVAKSALGDKAGAIKDYDKAIELNPNYASAYNNKAYCLCDLKHYKEALINVTRSLAIEKTNAALDTRGVINTNLSKFNEAKSDLDEAIKMNSNDAEYYEHRAALYRKMAEAEEYAAKKEDLIKLAETDEAKAQELKK